VAEPELIGFDAPDGLRLSARVWAGPKPDAPVVLCLHGLTRNGRDFEPLAAVLASRWRVVAPDQRGRGRSAYDPDPLHYNAGVQVADTFALLDHLGVGTCVVVGTSMGALMGVAMANLQPDRVAGLVLNDAGPDVDPRGLARIAGYVGQGGPVTTWDEAAIALQAIHGGSYPTYRPADWLRMARATFVEAGDGLRPDYDANLARAFGVASGAGPDLWPAFEVCSRIPTLVLRGALSDILARDTVVQMIARFGVGLAEIPDRGHAPDLSEPEALAAIEAFLVKERVQARWR
jgi:pimeloyl-ACP methyl ester carboxylesterase